MLNFHLDTDFGGDPDDFEALLMLLGLPDVNVTGITTVLDNDGLRAGAVRRVLEDLGRTDIPLCAGARVGLTKREVAGPRTDFWSDVTPLPANTPGESIATIERSMWMHSVFTLIGPFTNGAMFERVRGGLLRERHVVHMGGFIHPPAANMPQWTAADDFNVQWDTCALEELYKSFADITMVPLPVAMHAWVTTSDVERIECSGPLGKRLADQMRAWANDMHWSEIGQAHVGLPDNLAGIMWDPVTVLIATGWEGATIERMSLMPYIQDGIIHFEIDEAEGRPVDVVTAFDNAAFRDTFLTAIERAQANS
ncbi:MAG: nucleoside hydrolase [Thermomicrobiales bacterium]|nr:nucleoside hydrolase [Thermomicrobiales bacterium]